jgi:hypothetical protein
MVEAEAKVDTTSGEIKTNWTESVENFDDLNIKPDLLRGIYGKIKYITI